MAINGYISALLLDSNGAMLVLDNHTSRPVRIPKEIRQRVRPDARVVAFLDGLDVVDWTLCG